ncbi:MAG TPA: ATP-binding protein [Geminicoccaceae bacterium]|nr:ATP-binding protein [Geminicoccus sp.]HMU49785.1 ATP-binding protein [Geminicoccaceae bacterium]
MIGRLPALPRPFGFGGRLALLLAGLVIVAGVAVGLALLGEPEIESERPLPPGLAGRIAAIVRLVERAPEGELRDIARAISGRGFHVRIGSVDSGLDTPLEGAWRGWQRPLVGALGERLPGHRVRLRHLHPREAEASWGRRRPVLELAVSAGPHRWVLIGFGPESLEPPSTWRLVLIGGGVLAAVLIVALLAARRFAAPVLRLAAAADRLGQDLDAPPLAETKGPRELRAAARAFNRMQERLRSFVADRTRMLAAISHDLRTSLTRMRLRMELIEDDEIRAKATRDLEEMQAMLEATLAFARDDAKGEPRVAIDLAELVQTACDAFADAGHTVSYAGPPHLRLHGRQTALRRLLDNLIDNAIKYGGGAEIGLRAAADVVEIDVADRGPGIPASEREHVFEPFYRLEQSRSRETGGTGLGLAVARGIARAHGGDVTLRDRDGGGLVATIRLPRSAG